MTGTTCGFCGRDPYEYVHNGLGYEPVAVTCCELGQEVFNRGDDEDEVTITRGELAELGNRLRAAEAETTDDQFVAAARAVQKHVHKDWDWDDLPAHERGECFAIAEDVLSAVKGDPS